MKKLAIYFLFLTSLCRGQAVKFEKVFGGANEDHGLSVQQTFDRGYIIAGTTGSYGAGSSDVYLMKLDSNGNFKWRNTFGGANIDWGYSVQQTADSGFVIAGFTNSFGHGGYDVYLIRTDSIGDTLWTKTYGGTNWDFGYSVSQTSDGGFIVAGGTYSSGNGNEDVYLVKTNASGIVQWDTTYGGAMEDVANEVKQTTDGGYIVTGNTKSFGAGGTDVYLLKINPSGDTSWTKTFGGTNEDEGNSVCQTSDGGFIIGGASNSWSAGNYNQYFIRTDMNGDTLWTKLWSGTTDRVVQNIKTTSDGGYVSIGWASGEGAGGKDMLFFKWTSGGWPIACGFNTYGSAGDEIGYSIQQTADKGFVFVGTTTGYGMGLTDIYIVKMDSNCTSTGNVIADAVPLNTNPLNGKTTVYPNPFSDFCNLTISKDAGILENATMVLYDILGNKTVTIPVKGYEVRIDRNNLQSGIYFYLVKNRDAIVGKGKLIVCDE
jgi:hypothetical protein